MALSSSIFSDIGGAVSDLFAANGATTQANLKAQGLDISAEGLRLKAQGDLSEASNYDIASSLALQNEKYTETSTAIQEMQQERSNYLQIGGQRAEIGGAGLSESGSSLDLLADSARQGALTKAVLGQQGFITEAGYQEQAQSYQTMAGAARTAAAGEEQMAGQTDTLAQETIAAGQQQAKGDMWSGIIKGVAGIAGIVAAPFTGGASLAAATAIGGLLQNSAGDALQDTVQDAVE